MHTAVLKKETLEVLDPKPGENFIDGTFGGGGHSLAILEKIAPNGRLLGIDQDPEIIKRSRLLNPGLILINDNFANLENIVRENSFSNVHGILLDLGFSSWHLEESGKGFSFQKDEPLDMRYGQNTELTAAEILNSWPGKEIEKILKEYGQERFAEKIALEIVKARTIKKITGTGQLAEIIKKAVPARYGRQRIHPATKTFQALRITVNNELDNLKKVLPQAINILEAGGRLAIISFHSLEDKIVKNFFKENFQKGILEILTKKPILPSGEEIKSNLRARSAKLRAARKL